MITTTAVLSFGIGVLTLITRFLLHLRKDSSPSKQPPVLPYLVPLVGHALSLTGDIEGLFRSAIKRFGFGNPFTLWVAGRTIYVFPHPKAASEVFRRASSLTFTLVLPFILHKLCGTSEAGVRILSESVLDGNGYKREPSAFETAHSFFSTRLAQGKPVSVVAEPIKHELHRILSSAFQESMDERFDHQVAEGEWDLRAFAWARRAISVASTNTIFGKRLLQIEPHILDYLFEYETNIHKIAAGYPRWLARGPYKARNKVQAALREWIRTVDEPGNKEHSALFIREALDYLLTKQLDDQDVGAVAFGIFLATQFNSATTAFWFIAHLAKRPDLVAAIREEVAPAYAVDPYGSPDTKYLLEHCPILEAAFNESLRLYASAASVRVAATPVSVDSVSISKGAIVIAPVRQTHLNPDLVGPNPTQWDHERFLRNKGLKNAPCFRPFGGGDSLCSGKWLAQQEICVFIAELFRGFEVEFLGEIPKPYEQRNGGGILCPRDIDVDVRMRVKRRSVRD